MRPAQRKLARALRPQTEHRAQMLQATVVTGFSADGASSPALYSDSFARADRVGLGSTDGGTAGPTPWRITDAAYQPTDHGFDWHIADNAATVPLPYPDTGQYAPTASYTGWAWIETGHVGGVHQVTLRRLYSGGGGAITTGVVGLIFESGGQVFLDSPGTPFFGVMAGTYHRGRFGLGFTQIQGAPTPADGDVITVIDSGVALTYRVNGTTVDTLAYAGNPYTFSGLFLQTHPSSALAAVSDWSYTPRVGTSGGGDVEVDFGDGVAVACPRHAGCSPLVVGDLVHVSRQHHTNLVLDKIIPLGDS